MASGKKQGYSEADGILLTLVLILAVFGLTMLFSTSEYNGRVRFGDSAYYFKKQLFAMFLGLLTNRKNLQSSWHGTALKKSVSAGYLLRFQTSSAGAAVRLR